MILDDIAVWLGDDTARESGARPGRDRGHHVGADEQLVGGGRGRGAATAGGAVADGSGGDVEGFEAAVLEDADIRVGGGRAKVHGDGIAVRRRAGDVLGVVDGLAEIGTTGWPHGEGVGVATGIGDGADGGGGVVPADDDHVQVTGGLGGGVGDGDRARLGLGSLRSCSGLLPVGCCQRARGRTR